MQHGVAPAAFCPSDVLCTAPMVPQPVLHTGSGAAPPPHPLLSSTFLSFSLPSDLVPDPSFPSALGGGYRRAAWLPRSLPGHVPQQTAPVITLRVNRGAPKASLSQG